MKRILKLSIPFFVAFLIFPSSFAVVTPIKLPAATETPAKASPFAGMTASEFISLTPKKYRELTGKRLSPLQRISLKLAQSRVKRMIRKGYAIDMMLIAKDVDTNNFDILGFILGIVLGPIGILISYIAEGRSSSMFLWSLYGALIWLGIFLLVVLVL